MIANIEKQAEAFPPGEYLREELDARDWTVTEFAEILGRPIQAISEIINGKKEITTETAIAIGEALGTSPAMWLNLQTNYRLFLYRARLEAPASLPDVARRARLRSVVPLAEIRKRGWISDTKDLDSLEAEVADLLGIEQLDEKAQFAIAARRSNSAEGLTIEQIAWLGRVRSIAKRRTTPAFNIAALADLAARLPRLLASAEVMPGTLRSWFADCGVTLIVVEGLRGGKLDGAVTFVDRRGVIGLTARGDRFDGFLFTLLHECAHLTLGHIKGGQSALVDDDIGAEVSEQIENEANIQAIDWLFPGGFECAGTSVAEIRRAASRFGVHPSVVIGQVQKQTGLWNLHRAHIAKIRHVFRDETS
jgi:HTH-type transcriptional regulator / antitoxin HigA